MVDSLAAAKENDELMIPPELKSTKEFEYHVSDTLDSLQGNVATFYFLIIMLHWAWIFSGMLDMTCNARHMETW